MRHSLTLAVLAAVLFSGLIGWQWKSEERGSPVAYLLEVRARASRAGTIQLFYDNGAGYTEERSSRATLQVSEATQAYLFSLPAGTFRSLRLDPIDGEGRVTIESIRVLDGRSKRLLELPLSEFRPANDIASFDRDAGTLAITSRPGPSDPQLVADFEPPLTLRPSWLTRFLGVLGLPGVRVLLGLGVLIATLSLWKAPQTVLRGVVQWATVRPKRFIALGSGVAAIVASYPVLFLGQSLVSPDGGTSLLYADFPTLPGYAKGALLDTKGSDVGAIMWQHIAYSVAQRRALQHGELPLWNRSNSLGAPLLGQGQSMFGDPLHWLPILANGAAWSWDMKYVLAKWLWGLGIGLTVWLLTRSPFASLLMGVAAIFIGFFIYRINHPAIFSLSYSPWILFAYVALDGESRLRRQVLAAGVLVLANISTLASGTIKEAYTLLLCLNVNGVLYLGFNAKGTRRRSRNVAIAVIAWLLATGITAPLWVTFFRSLSVAHMAYGAPAAFQIQPALLLGFFDEAFYRPLSTAGFVYNPSLNLLIAFGFVYFIAAAILRPLSRGMKALALSSLVPFAIAFGLVPPNWLVAVPLLRNLWHVDNCFSCVLVVQWTVLAGVGYAMAANELKTQAAPRGLVISAILFGGAIAVWAAFFHVVAKPNWYSTFSPIDPTKVSIPPFLWWYLLLSILALAVFICVVRQYRRTGLLHPLSGLALILCCATLLWRFGLHAAPLGDDDFVVHPKTRVDFHAASEGVRDLEARVRREPSRVSGLSGALFPGWSGVYGLESPAGVDALSSRYLRELVAHVEGWQSHIFTTPEQVARYRRLLDALNVRYYISSRVDEAAKMTLPLVGKTDLHLYESPSAWPRAYYIDSLQVYESVSELAERFEQGSGMPFAAVQRADATGEFLVPLVRAERGEARFSPATNYVLTENSTEFTVSAPGPGVAVLLESFWPADFAATIDGEAAPIIRVNHAFKGVTFAKAGTYRVVFKYRPKYLGLALAVSVLCGSVCLAALAASVGIVSISSRRLNVARSLPG